MTLAITLNQITQSIPEYKNRYMIHHGSNKQSLLDFTGFWSPDSSVIIILILRMSMIAMDKQTMARWRPESYK